MRRHTSCKSLASSWRLLELVRALHSSTKMVYREKVLRHSRPWQWLDSKSLEVIQHNMSAMGTGIVILEAKTIPIGSYKGHDKRFNDVVSVVYTSNSALAYVKISSLIGCDTTPNCYTVTSITIMWTVGCIKISLPPASPSPLSTIKEVQHKPWLVGDHDMRPLA